MTREELERRLEQRVIDREKILGTPSALPYAGKRTPEHYRKRLRATQDDPVKYSKAQARKKVSDALRSGRMLRGGCVVCGAPDTEAHHLDYDNPFNIEWRCKEHHDDVTFGRSARDDYVPSNKKER